MNLKPKVGMRRYLPINLPSNLSLWCAPGVGFVFLLAASIGYGQEEKISFNRDIRPILSDKCFRCHGPDEHSREADLRFDIQEDAMRVIAPGDPEASDMLYRILETDSDLRMPPPSINKDLEPAEIDLIRKWIEQGADWSEFWAYVAPTKHAIPDSKQFDEAANWIDRLVSAKLENLGLRLSPEADKITLARRAYLDLTGLPPTPRQMAEFLNDDSENAFERLVDQLLDSPRFGERMAVSWLDLVRYADTVGYHGDQDHNISPYRDWVIDAFNQNMPFDQFTREQLAGDLLPDATNQQKIATGYNRLLQTTHEGGLQPREYSSIYAADRVRNVSSVWMGATIGCAQCHDHKYDPYSTKDFYALAAFFADIDDEKHFKVGTNELPTKRPPELLIISAEDRKELDEINAKVIDLQRTIAEKKKANSKATEAPSRPPNQPQDNAVPGQANEGLELHSAPTELVANQELGDLTQQLADAMKLSRKIEQRGRWTMITQALKTPRTVRILPRGNWMDDSGPIVQPAIPEMHGTIDAEGQRLSRLHLANWLVDGNQISGKLTARVMANRIWYLFMGVGVARSLDDFGGQGEAPTYPELLDNLAIELVDSHWDIKSLVRQVVTSRTYRQSSLVSPEIRERDPYNGLFARQSRYRLPAEFVRDSLLSISGLLVSNPIGGRSVKPYQPTGYYQHLNFPKREYKAEITSAQWRRGVYMHWQRQFLHPTLKALDAPSREECTAQRPRSNTPSAALALLNDPTFIEAARGFAERILREPESDATGDRLDFAFLNAMSRYPKDGEKDVLTELLESSLAKYKNDPDSANQLISAGLSPVSKDLDPVEWAAWTMVARTLFNTDEVISRN